MKKILILGGGYGGLKCATTLQKNIKDQELSVTLISKHDYHYPTTLLHKVAVGTYSDRKARIFYRNLLKKVNFIKDKVTKISIKDKKVYGKNNSVYDYDYLVIGLGFKVNCYDVKGADEFAYKISTLNKALLIRDNIETGFKNYSFTNDKNALSFIICGSGFTGVEFAAELAKKIPQLCKISGIDPKVPKVYLIGRGKRILPMFEEKLSLKAQQKLQACGVTLVKGNVIEIRKNCVFVKNEDGNVEEIYGNTIVWSAGVKGSPVISNSELKNKNDRICVNEYLQMIEHDDIFVVGDCAIANDRDLIHAPTAQLASQMGEYCAYNLLKLTSGKILDKPFKFIHRGTVCSIGHTDGIGLAYGINLSGEVAAFLKNIIENKWILSISNIITVFKKGQFRFRSSD